MERLEAQEEVLRVGKWKFGDWRMGMEQLNGYTRDIYEPNRAVFSFQIFGVTDTDTDTDTDSRGV
jgi:hypothetical protein